MLDHGDTWRFDVKPLAKIEGRIIEFLIRRSGPEIQVVALGLALEATERVLGKVRRLTPEIIVPTNVFFGARSPNDICPRRQRP